MDNAIALLDNFIPNRTLEQFIESSKPFDGVKTISLISSPTQNQSLILSKEEQTGNDQNDKKLLSKKRAEAHGRFVFSDNPTESVESFDCVILNKYTRYFKDNEETKTKYYTFNIPQDWKDKICVFQKDDSGIETIAMWGSQNECSEFIKEKTGGSGFSNVFQVLANNDIYLIYVSAFSLDRVKDFYNSRNFGGKKHFEFITNISSSLRENERGSLLAEFVFKKMSDCDSQAQIAFNCSNDDLLYWKKKIQESMSNKTEERTIDIN